MIPFLILTSVWAFAISAELIQRPFLKNPAFHLLFPVGFVILAIIRVSLGFYLFFDSMRIAGAMDGSQLTQDGLVFSRALIVLGSAATLSFISTLIILLWRPVGRTGIGLNLMKTKKPNKAWESDADEAV